MAGNTLPPRKSKLVAQNNITQGRVIKPKVKKVTSKKGPTAAKKPATTKKGSKPQKTKKDNKKTGEVLELPEFF